VVPTAASGALAAVELAEVGGSIDAAQALLQPRLHLLCHLAHQQAALLQLSGVSGGWNRAHQHHRNRTRCNSDYPRLHGA
jgi:hypothetical protein